MAAILSPLGLYGGNQKPKLPLRPNTRLHAPEGHSENLLSSHHQTDARRPHLRSLDASHAISTCVLHFEVSWLHRRTMVRPVKPTFQTGLMLLPSVFSLGFVDQPRNPVIFWWTTGNPVNSVQPLPITTLDLAHTKSRLNLGFEALPRNRPWLHLAILATMQPTLDSTSHRLLRTKPTCLFHTWRPHQPWPFVLVLHLHQHQSSRTLPCHT
jgi:hypothetical protein